VNPFYHNGSAPCLTNPVEILPSHD
jgi:hypothetical protein